MTYKATSLSKQAGFTMVELLIVIVIIGILSVIGLNNFLTAQLKARDSQRKSDLATITKGLEMYYNDKGRYPAASNNQIFDGVAEVAWGSNTGFTDALVTGGAVYLSKMPKDPSKYQYFYATNAGGTYYKIYARLENANDGQIGSYAGTDCGGTLECNFGLSSSNETP